jgi:hypothetical protein
LQVQFLEKLVLPLNELLFAYAEQNSYLGGQPPEFFIVDDPGGMRVVFLPSTEAVLQLEDVDRVILDLVIVVVGRGHGGDQQIHDEEHHGEMEAEEVRPGHPSAATIASILLRV